MSMTYASRTSHSSSPVHAHASTEKEERKDGRTYNRVAELGHDIQSLTGLVSAGCRRGADTAAEQAAEQATEEGSSDGRVRKGKSKEDI